MAEMIGSFFDTIPDITRTALFPFILIAAFPQVKYIDSYTNHTKFPMILLK